MSTESPPEGAVERRLRELLGRPDFPAFSQHIHELMRRADDEHSSVRNVTKVILKDYSVTLRVLRAANSPIYNRSGRPILSVTHAASLLGLQAIRDIAGSLMLFEHFRARSSGVKELMLLSLLTANHVREMAGRLDYPRLEEAYLCGMFRNLGEILIACYFPQDYDQILAEMKSPSITERSACQRVLHFSYEDLGRAMVRHWAMPETVACSMRDSEPSGGRVTRDNREFLAALSSFGHAMTAAIYRSEPGGGRARLSAVRDRYMPLLGFRAEDMQAVADHAVCDTKETFDAARIPLDDLRLRKQVEAAATRVQAGPPPQAEASEENVLESLALEISAMIEGQPDFEINDVILMAVEALFRGGPFDRVLFALVSREQNLVQGRVGLGEGIDDMVAGFSFPLSIRGGPAAVALLRRQDIFAFGVRDGRFDNSDFVRNFGGQYFGLCPVIVEGVVVGCLYFDRKTPEPVPKRQQELIAGLRDLVARAILKRRIAATPISFS